ncbi:MAG: NAD(P)/FAD-dependent oxidoreductase [Campylobacterales bacterium]|nr:NAD(P)/FAD-dependent oxidoreductase [Campylobacterales bacterium]
MVYDVIIIGAGAGGMMASIIAGREGKKVLLLEKLSKVGAKLKATGGGRCNLTNTLDNEKFMESFGRNGKFMMNALRSFDHRDLLEFFGSIGVETHIPDGFHVFPKTHNSQSIIDGMVRELENLEVEVRTNQDVRSLEVGEWKSVTTQTDTFRSENVIIATGGLGYPALGTTGDGFFFAKELEHKVTDLYPAMTPLVSKEKWVGECRADTIGNATIKVDLKKHKKLKAVGDLIFTKDGIRGPIVLDFAREITPLLEKYGDVPLLINMTKGMNEDEIYRHFKSLDPSLSVLEFVQTLLPKDLSLEICKLSGADNETKFSKLLGEVRGKLIKNLAWTPLTIINHQGFEKAMITRGGISLKEIRPETMESKLVKGIYFCGEVVDLDGPCGGYNLQWAFSSGYLAGKVL